MVFPFWFSISLTSNSFLPFFFSLWFFYINHAIVTPLHPFGLLVSKKDYIYPCSRYANNPYTLVAHCFLFSFSSLSPFFSVLFLLYHLSSPFLSPLFPFLLLGLPVSFSVMLIPSFLPSLPFFSFSPCFFFLFCSLQTQIVCEREHNLCSWIISLSLSFLSLLLLPLPYGPVQLSTFPLPPSPFLSLLSLYPFSPFYPFISLSQPS